MQHSIALKRYLQRYICPDLPAAPAASAARWQHCLIIPAYDESPALLDTLQQLPGTTGNTLVILVLNRPDSEPRTDCNSALRGAIQQRQHLAQCDAGLITLAPGVELFLYDLEQTVGPCPASQGVGLARKYGCDIALTWMHQGAIRGDWLCSTDADARLPAQYFQQLDTLAPTAAAASLPFTHGPGSDPACDAATALYELRLHHYVLGLEYANSPYAYHTLGSSLAIRAHAYAAVRGFPRRAGGEDFYLLNKLAKVGAIARPAGNCIELESRPSHRVPFGTGPAVSELANSDNPQQQPLFYHPQCFHALRCLLRIIPLLAENRAHELAELLRDQALEQGAIDAVLHALSELGWEAGLAHCYSQSKTTTQFQRQFHQWFDGFRSLKFIHAMRAAGWQDQSLQALDALQPGLWPTQPGTVADVTALRAAVREHLGWRTPHHSYST